MDNIAASIDKHSCWHGCYLVLAYLLDDRMQGLNTHVQLSTVRQNLWWPDLRERLRHRGAQYFTQVEVQRTFLQVGVLPADSAGEHQVLAGGPLV